MKKKPSPESPPVVVRLPNKVVVALDRAAKRNSRTRSGEVRNRLMESLAAEARS